jgi:hypothetical protein
VFCYFQTNIIEYFLHYSEKLNLPAGFEVVWRKHDISEEHISSNFRVEE